MSCSFPDDFEIATKVFYEAFKASFADALVCAETYLRPDPGGSLIPWLYAVFLLLFHLPACIIRAVQWESAQYLALVLAVAGIALTTQAYQSTALKAEEVLVWMPLTLVLDVGAMMQMVVLIIEKHHGVRPLWWACRDALRAVKEAIVDSFSRRKGNQRSGSRTSIELEQRESGALLAPPVLPPLDQPADQNDLPAPPQPAADLERQEPRPEPRVRDPPYAEDTLRHAAVALCSFILLLALIALQLHGLYAAIQGRKQKDLKVKWCSPSFRDFALAVTTGNCERYAVLESSSNGIGCIELPASQQQDWLLGTIVALVAAIVCQIADAILLMCTSSERRCRGVRVQRPWLTMFGGVIMLVLLIAFGVFNANRLPTGVTDVAWIYRKEPSAAVGRVCQVRLKSPGLRGVIIGYTDGLFEGWGSLYQGSVMRRLVRKAVRK